jgi:hypothetical protein
LACSLIVSEKKRRTGKLTRQRTKRIFLKVRLLNCERERILERASKEGDVILDDLSYHLYHRLVHDSRSVLWGEYTKGNNNKTKGNIVGTCIFLFLLITIGTTKHYDYDSMTTSGFGFELVFEFLDHELVPSSYFCKLSGSLILILFATYSYNLQHHLKYN